MKFKVLSENSVKVLVETEDIRRFDMPLSALRADDPKTLEFIYRLLFMVLEETDVSFLESEVTVTARGGYGEGYYIVITRENGPSRDGIRFVMSGDVPENAMFIYTFREYRDILGLRHCLERFPAFAPRGACLRRYGETYYILLEFTPEQVADKNWTIFESELGEFYRKCQKPYDTEAFLAERGTLICPALFEKIKKE